MHADTFAAAGLLAACLFFAAPAARAGEPLTVRTAHYELRLNGDTGDIESFTANGRGLIQAAGAPRACLPFGSAPPTARRPTCPPCRRGPLPRRVRRGTARRG